MKKRIFACVLISLMFVGCLTIIVKIEEKKLDKYKSTIIQELNVYKETKVIDNLYYESEKIEMNSILEKSTSDIQNAKGKDEINLIEYNTKIGIDLVKTKEMHGLFFSLQEAYENSFLTIDDIKLIATGKFDINQISSKVQYAIKESYLKLLKEQQNLMVDIEDISILNYYGKYSDFYVVQIADSYSISQTEEMADIVGGITIKYNGQNIVVWKKNGNFQEEKIDIDEDEFLHQFDLTDAKISYFDNSCDYYTDRVVVILKKCIPNAKIDLEYFHLNNGKYLYRYAFSGDSPNNRQILTIYLKEQGKEKVIDAVNELNKLEFVRLASPDYIYHTQDDNL